jgi:hypothetical protein
LLQQNEEFRQPEIIPPEQLDMYSAKFILSVKKKCSGGKFNQNKDEDYKPENLTAFDSQYNSTFFSKDINIKSHDVSKHSRAVLLLKKRDLKKKRQGKPNTCFASIF